MRKKTAHEPKAKVMSAEDAWEDSERILTALRENLLKADDPLVGLQIPLSLLLSAVDNLKRDELILLQKRVKTRLTA